MDQQVLQCLQATLSPEERVRKHAEEQLQQLFRVPEGELSLARILLSQEVALPQRQSAGVLLQQYITQHWTPASISFQQPITPIEVKAQIRPIVFHGLSDPQRKIRLASAFALSSIARFDWPEDYPDLLSQLVSLLSTDSSNSVHGAMRVISDLVRNDLSEDQLLPVVQDLLPTVLSILGNAQAHSPSTRASTVQVFRQVVRMLETVKDEHPQAVRSAIDSIGPVWFGAFTQLLSVDAAQEVQQNWESLIVRIEIFRTFNLFLNAFPRLITPRLSEYIRLAVLNLTSLLSIFSTYYLSSDSDAPEPPSPTSDVGMNDPKIGIDDLACAIFDFLTPAVRTKGVVSDLVEGDKGTNLMERIIGVVLDYTQVTRENEEEWMEDANAFVVDDDDETEQYGTRTGGHDLVGSIMDKYPGPAAIILNDITQQRAQESAAARQRGQPDWWKGLESTLALLGGISDDLRDRLDDDASAGRVSTFDVHFLIDQVIPGLLGQNETPFLQGRAFVFASQFASSLSDALAQQYLGAAVHALESPDINVPVKISAVKTIKNFCRFINASVMQPQSGKILSLLLPLLQQTSNETLYLLLETVRAVIALDKELLDGQSTSEIAERIYEVWLKYTTDPVLTAIVEELVEALIALPSPDITAALVRQLAPRLAAVIAEPVTDDTIHMPGEAIQLANSLIRTRGGPLEQELISTVTAAVIGCLRDTDDMDVIQHGMLHLTLVVRKDCDKLVAWQNADGNGIANIFNLLARFLTPTFSESGGIFTGELIMHLFRKAGPSIGPVLPDLLRAIVNRLSTAQMPSFVQSLVLPFAYLFGTEHTQSTIDLLSSFTVTSPDGASTRALDIVLAAWGETADTITGSWNIRVSDMGLSKLFAMSDSRLQEVIVKGDLVISEANRNTIMTRSRTKLNPHQYTQISFPLKAFKLILKDVAIEPGAKGKGKGRIDYDIDEDDGDEDWDDEDPLGGADPVGEFDYLSSWLDDKGGENDAQDDDEDLKSDPLAQIDLGQHLTEVLRQSYSSNSNGIHEMIDGLTEVEKGILRGVLTL